MDQPALHYRVVSASLTWYSKLLESHPAEVTVVRIEEHPYYCHQHLQNNTYKDITRLSTADKQIMSDSG